MFGPILREGHTSLEPPDVQDIETFRAWLADPEVTRNLFIRFAPSQKQEEEWLAS